MDQMAELIQHNIPIVTVLNLQKIRNHRIGRHAPDKILPRQLIPGRFLIPIFCLEICIHVIIVGFADLVTGHGIWDYLDQTADIPFWAGAIWDGAIWEN